MEDWEICLIIIVVIVVAALLIKLGIGIVNRCPNCRKKSALKEINRTLIKKERVSKIEKHYSYNKKGERTGSRDVRVYGTRFTYNVEYACKYCGEKTTKITYYDKY